ncbi:MAG: toll/interleukin-1 receptor domain-containing protein [Hyphomicrobiaceae bacterium]|nr:toll/interleukin-1 receptor domain-containing protein [Hyphomicrobiaceae bacterium]
MIQLSVTPEARRGRKRRKVFISYRRSDGADISGRIYDRLAGKFGAGRVIKDVYAIPAGADFHEFIEETIPSCSVLLAVISPNWSRGSADEPRSLKNAHDFVRMELACAFAHKVPVVPVLVGGARLPAVRLLPKEIAPLLRRQAVRVRRDPDFHHDIDRLLARI